MGGNSRSVESFEQEANEEVRSEQEVEQKPEPTMEEKFGAMLVEMHNLTEKMMQLIKEPLRK